MKKSRVTKKAKKTARKVKDTGVPPEGKIMTNGDTIHYPKFEEKPVSEPTTAVEFEETQAEATAVDVAEVQPEPSIPNGVLPSHFKCAVSHQPDLVIYRCYLGHTSWGPKAFPGEVTKIECAFCNAVASKLLELPGDMCICGHKRVESGEKTHHPYCTLCGKTEGRDGMYGYKCERMRPMA